MSTQIRELIKIIATNPQWLENPEKRLMIVKMAIRLDKELKGGNNGNPITHRY